MATITTDAATAVVFDLRPAARRLARLVEGVHDGWLDAATPCEEFTVRDLLGHLHGLSAVLSDAAAKRVRTGTAAGAGACVLSGDWRRELPRRIAELADCWHRHEAWEGAAVVDGTTLPAGVVAQISLGELVLHGWDLARATGQAFHCDKPSLQVVYALLAPEADNPARAPMFAPVVDVPYGSPFLDRVVGLGGRDPGWSPRACGPKGDEGGEGGEGGEGVPGSEGRTG
ncbi:TIGR03086 family metal-binding protein [Streptomyces sp. NPDC091272]|uniref:TIGR03086 family metal-binding protein n=1 Tax=Streptomyces sp. NPDC091272 TaxID=3365981 RepID=UPI0037F94117